MIWMLGFIRRERGVVGMIVILVLTYMAQWPCTFKWGFGHTC